MEHFAHLSALELARTRTLHYRDVASDSLSLAAILFGGVLLSLAARCPLF